MLSIKHLDRFLLKTAFGLRNRRGSTASEHRLVMDILWNASAGLGVCRDYRLVAGDLGDDDSLLQKVEDSRWLDCAVFGVGQFCERAELYDLAIECLT